MVSNVNVEVCTVLYDDAACIFTTHPKAGVVFMNGIVKPVILPFIHKSFLSI